MFLCSVFLTSPYYGPFYETLTYDTGAPVVTWRAEAKKDNSNVPGDIADADALCISE